MKLLIAGAGGHGRVVADTALATGAYSSLAFLDDREANLVTSEGWSILGPLRDLGNFSAEFQAFAAGFGNAALRLEMLSRARDLGFHCASIIHPAAVVSKYCSIDEGSVVFAGGCINVGARIGTACIINTGATVDHDCVVADGVHICPGAHLAGSVEIGPRTWFGVGAVAREGIKIGSDVIVGAGAVVVRDIPDRATVAGNPAKALMRRAHHQDASLDISGAKD
jgi:sugar O-acyltransferase (sialic acid O-acetyltransferase NeuD family)